MQPVASLAFEPFGVAAVVAAVKVVVVVLVGQLQLSVVGLGFAEGGGNRVAYAEEFASWAG